MDAYTLCRSKVAKTNEERLVCAKMYVKTFPSCYFKGKIEKDTCADDTLQGFSKCVMDSASYGERFACDNKKNERRQLCRTPQSKRESKLAALFVRSSIQACNECGGNYDACLAHAAEELDYDVCLAAYMGCSPGC